MSSVVLTVRCREHAWTSALDRRDILTALRAMLSALKKNGLPDPRRVEAHLVDDRTMRDVNRRFLSCDGPTNVLSFPGGGDMPGLILVSSGTLRRECLLYGQPARGYMLSLLAHGLAHLAGLGHGTDMSRMCEACVEAAENALP
ncbi:MAG: rRNA maturation RNase YbeY [Desulfovibrio sp.]|jgi:probable rRNA maturation factor|nr:rRNA maturation RNase YbeY [Desulfovibrio sp.]